MRRKLQFLAVCLEVLFITSLIFVGPLTSGAQAAEKPIRIGFSMALSGGLGSAGKAALLSLQICAEDINAKGGVLGRPVELVYYDDRSDPVEASNIYTKLIKVDKVDFVLGPYATAPIAAALPVAMENKMVFVALFGVANNEQLNYKYYFQILPAGPEPYIGWSNGFFELASQQTPKPKTVALLAEDNAYGINAQIGAERNAKKYGFEIVYKKKLASGTTDCTPMMKEIKELKPDIVYLATYPPAVVSTIKAAKEVGLKPKIFGGGLVGAQYTSVQTGLGPDLNGIIFQHFWVPEPTLKFPGIEEFLKKYQTRAVSIQGLDPLGYYLTPWAYAYLQVLSQAIEATKSLDQATVGEYIRNNTFETIVGKIKFAPNGEWTVERVLQVQVQNVKSHDVSEFSKSGTFIVLYPKEFVSGKIIYPFLGWEEKK